MSDGEKLPLGDRLANAAFVAVMSVARLLPYERRIPALGWLFSNLLAPVAGWRRRIRDNLALARPDLTREEVEDVVRAVPNNAGRSVAEIYSGHEFTDRIRSSDPLEGPGLPELEAAFASGRPVIIACAHFGNYDAMRTALSARGWPVGALYRPMNNEAFNRHYIPAITAIAEPLFPRGRAGLAAMLRFLKGGGWLALGYDQFDRHAPELQFFDLPSRTVLTPAELAIRYNALILPVHGIRQPDGLSFRVHVGEPVEHDEPAVMMQALNDDLEALVRRHMEQWFWVHRRWK
ncbi:lysophospholipid acyltransferase family protein [Paracoccus onubensis]|uniref:lysophospholipid acyltransferase family protein n=1 Tax=Paracoccus onubensis TaxID=1675788 RepID=UPI002731CA6B|nr:lysophospholipid acyltransferase family protein [Paracoccus onubensis]MDP0925884.1 lysophospholipid acyltransferase family protein [Paracoccus onubensis]